MSTITSIYDISKKQFEIQTNGTIYPGFVELQFSFISNQEISFFNNLNFGYSIIKEGAGTLKAERFPEIGVRYEQADKTPIHSVKIELELETNYILHIWSENANEISNTNYNLNIGRPKKPFDSWIWNGNDWEAPVPAPDCDRRWDENNKIWIVKS